MSCLKILTIAIVGLLFVNPCFAYDFEVDGIYYNVLSGTDNEVEVTRGNYQLGYSNDSYQGDVIIPSNVVYSGIIYNVTVIGANSFRDSGDRVSSITIPNTIKSINKNAFMNCTNLANFDLPNSITSIEQFAFRYCSKLESIIIPDQVTSIEIETFEGCTNLKSVKLPNSLVTIKDGAFFDCKNLQDIILPNYLQSIERNAFYRCERLTQINLPSSLISIDNNAFRYCSNLLEYNTEIKEPFRTGAFVEVPSDAVLRVPFGTRDEYQNCYSWNYFKEIVEKPAFYTLTIKATGNGSASYDGVSIKGKTNTFTVTEGVSATITFNPASGYRIKSVKVNNTDVTAGLHNNAYTISNISSDTSLEVEFEAIPPTTYTLSISASGNGSATYSSTTIKNQIKSFTVEEGTSATISFVPDNGYRIASVKVNNSDVTSSLTNNQYTISNISANTTVEVTFEAIPPTTYTLSISATGNGSATYSSTAIKNQTKSFTVEEGSSATISFTSDNGYRIASVKVNNTDVTSSVTNNRYTISNISANTTVEVAFEAIPPTTYTLSISATGNGSATYSSTAIKNQTKSFTVEEGSSATISFTSDNGYRIASVKVNNSDVTSSLTNNQYTISNISANTTVEVTFEAIPPTTYILSITATGNGCVNATYGSPMQMISVRGETSIISVTDIYFNLKFSPDVGYKLKSLKVNGSDVTSLVSKDNYFLLTIKGDTSVEVEFEENSTYILTIASTGNGSASYNGTSIRGKTSTFTVNEGISATISFSPDNGYGIKRVKVNNTDVTSKVSNNSYTISNISSDTSVEVEFEAIPPSTYTLSIKATGNGSASYNGTSIRGKTSTFTINEGTSATISFSPDNGYRIKSVKVNNTDVTSKVSNNSYTISNISSDTSMEVEFEALPPITYTLSIKATGNGSATYNGTTIRGKTNSFTVEEGTSVSIAFTPDNSYRIKSVKVNNTDVTFYVSNNEYTINSIKSDTSVEVVFEANPTHTLTITSTGNGSASYSGTTIRGKTSSFTVYEGTSAMVSFTPDSGYRIANVKENSKDVTANVTNNRYTINSITANTKLEVTFEEIPPTTYSLSITATGNGSVTYNNVTLINKTQTFTVNEGEYATISISPESGYRIKSVMLNSTDVTANVKDNKYTTSKIISNTTMKVTFEAIPITTYTLTIKAIGNGSASYDGTTVREKTSTFTVNEGTSVSITFSPDNGNNISSVKVDGNDVTSEVSGNRYVIENVTTNVSVEVTFIEDVNALTVEGVNFKVTSQSDKTIIVVGGDFGQVLTVPAEVTQNGTTWEVTGIDNDALKNHIELAAIIWNPEVAFTATVNNPNLLLYVKAEEYNLSGIKNVIVNGTASNITLVDDASGNSFYCPQAFTAQKTSYTHTYSMTTGVGETKGWETIALPFDVQTVKHISKGTIVPFAKWKQGDIEKPFWLYELTGNGFKPAESINAYTPYIISMPNNPQYDTQWLLNGEVTFTANSVTIGETKDVKTASYMDRIFTPCFTDKAGNEGLYALNALNDYSRSNGGSPEGSRFILNLRNIHPFEAYMTTVSGARFAIDIFEDMTTTIETIESIPSKSGKTIYDLQGRKINTPSKKGVYIINGKKQIIK